MRHPSVYRPIVALCVFAMTLGLGAAPAAADVKPAPGLLQCAVMVRIAADEVRGREGDSGYARSLGMKAGGLEERFRDDATRRGLDPIQVEITLAAEISAAEAAGNGGVAPEVRVAPCFAMADAGGSPGGN